jgi:hypothetical protein
LADLMMAPGSVDGVLGEGKSTPGEFGMKGVNVRARWRLTFREVLGPMRDREEKSSANG